MSIKYKLQGVIDDIDRLEKENARLEKLVDILGEPVICPVGSGVIAPGSEGVTVNYDPHRYHPEGEYEAVGVWFPGEHWSKTHWFKASVLDLSFDKKQGVPTLMYQVVYEYEKEKIDKFLAANRVDAEKVAYYQQHGSLAGGGE